MTHIGKASVSWGLLAAVCAATPALGQVIEFDHSRCTAEGNADECFRQFEMNASPGDRITLKIVNTIEAAFQYTIRGLTPQQNVARGTPDVEALDREFEQVEAPAGFAQLLGTSGPFRGTWMLGACRMPAEQFSQAADTVRAWARRTIVKWCPSVARDTVTISQPHESRFGGYIIRISRREEVAPAPLGDATVVIRVAESRWLVSFSGGVAISNLTDPRFIVRDSTIPREITDPSGMKVTVIDTVPFLQRDRNRENDEDASIMSFVTASHTRVPFLGLTLGLGLRTSGSVQFSVGPSLVLGDIGIITSGYTLGSVAEVPNGLQPGDPVSNANVLANLTTRMKRGWFVGLAFRFLGSQEAVKKILAGDSANSR